MSSADQHEFPRTVVIMEEPFNNVSGAGITVSNLFTGWPKEKIASIYWAPVRVETGVCDRRYYLRRERRWIFPLNLLLPRREPGGEGRKTQAAPGVAGAQRPLARVTSFGRTVWRALSRTIGGTEFMLKTELSDELARWITEFKPDIIYCAPTNYAVISLIGKIVRLTGAPLIVHVYDDWPSVVENGGVLQSLYGKRTLRAFRRLLDMAAYRFTISEEMCAEYERRYGLTFHSFHNCPDASVWLRSRYAMKEAPPTFTFRFIGVVYPNGNAAALKQIAAATECLRTMGVEAVFEIYTDSGSVREFRGQFSETGPVSLSEVPEESNAVAALYAGADGLVIAYDFSEFSASRFRLSIPTKFPAYLLSGTPIFLYAPETLAVTRRSASRGLAYVVDRPLEAAQLSRRMAEFIADPALRRSIADRGRQYAMDTMTSDVMRPVFRKTISDAAHLSPVRS